MLQYDQGHNGLAKIGLLSDSHGRAATTQRAVRLLIGHGAEMLIHLGDVGTVEVIDALLEPLPRDAGPDASPLDVYLVFGNTDWDADALGRYARSLGLHVSHPVGRLQCDGKTIVFQHGHQDAAMEAALASGADYLLHGHTHRTRDQRIGPTRVINPGALFRAAQYTVALLNTENDQLTFFTLTEEGVGG
ncbi:MAG: metallophosphoesterase family protein [Phycisphaeraceae bacterium]